MVPPSPLGDFKTCILDVLKELHQDAAMEAHLPHTGARGKASVSALRENHIPQGAGLCLPNSAQRRRDLFL